MRSGLLLTVSTSAIAAARFSAADGFRLTAAKKLTLSANALANDEKAATLGNIGADRKSISFDQKSVHLVIRTGPENDMLSYRLRGLKNPIITVRAGAMMTVLFVNTDGDMLHDFRLTENKPPFATNVSTSGSVGSAAIPHAAGKRFFSQELKLKAPSQPGGYTYVCTMRGHAAGGMFGLIRVR